MTNFLATRGGRGRPRQQPVATAAQAFVVMRSLPPRQREALKLCVEFARENDQLPPYHVLAKRMNCASANSAAEILNALARKGLLARNEVDKFRFARIDGVSLFTLAQQAATEAVHVSAAGA